MNIYFKKLDEEAQAPTRATNGSVGYDLTALDFVKENREQVWYRTGVGIQIPEGTVGLLFPRSSISKMGLMLANGVGVLDPDYRGEIQFRFHRHGEEIYGLGERIGQIVIVGGVATADLQEVEEFSKTERGEGGFGSTGR